LTSGSSHRPRACHDADFVVSLRPVAVSVIEAPDLRGMRVLVVDDDADNCDVLATILEHNGALVATAQSAADALSLFETQCPDVLISDIGLPGEDGFALLRKVRSLSASRGWDVPAIALTGYASLEGDPGGRCDGFQAQLTKPVTLDEVLIAISRVIEWPAAGAARRKLAG